MANLRKATRSIMKIETLSTFPHMYDSVMGESIMKRAQACGALDFRAYDLARLDARPSSHHRRRSLRRRPRARHEVRAHLRGVRRHRRSDGPKPYTIFLTPCGEPFDQGMATELSVSGAPAVHLRTLRRYRRTRLHAGRSLHLVGRLRAHVGRARIDGGRSTPWSACSTAFSATREAPSTRASTTACSNIRNTRVLRAIAAWTFPPVLECRATMPPSSSGDASSRCLRTARLRPDLLETANTTEDERAFLLSLHGDIFQGV